MILYGDPVGEGQWDECKPGPSFLPRILIFTYIAYIMIKIVATSYQNELVSLQSLQMVICMLIVKNDIKFLLASSLLHRI